MWTVDLNQIPNWETAQHFLLNNASPLLFNETIWGLRGQVKQRENNRGVQSFEGACYAILGSTLQVVCVKIL